MKKQKVLIPITKWHENHEWPKNTRAIRYLMKTYNCTFIIKLGGRYFIDEIKFYDWIEKNPLKPKDKYDKKPLRSSY